MFAAFLDGEGELELGSGVAALVVRDLTFGGVLERFWFPCGELGGAVVADGPESAAEDEVVEAGVGEGAGVVAVGGVEDAAFAFGADPCVGFFLAFLEDDAVWVAEVVDVGFVPCFEGFEALHDGVVEV